MSCNCCEEPPCPTPVIQCKTISASKSKCGYGPGDGHYYLVNTRTRNGTGESTFGDVTFHCSVDQTLIYTVNPTTCEQTITCFGTRTGSNNAGFYGPACSWTTTLSMGPFFCVWSTPSCGSGAWDCSTDPEPPEVEGYSDEYTNEMLLTNVVAALPAWPETWTSGCSSFRNLSPDQYSLSIRRMKWRISHVRTGTCYLKAWLRTRFVPEGGGDPTLTDLPPYTWTATGSPCFSATDEPPDSEANMITGEEAEEQEPSLDGTTTVEIVKWSCIPGYTPPDDGTANGYPLPE